jgi:hypothetical protein
MNNRMFDKMANKVRVKLWPPEQRFDGGPSGRPLELAPSDWIIRGRNEDGVLLHRVNSPHHLVLKGDQIHDFKSDPIRGEGYGFLTLWSQVNVGGDHVWFTQLPKG